MGCEWISDNITENYSISGNIYENDLSFTIENKIKEKIPLIINSKYGKFRKDIKSDSKNILENIQVKCCDTIIRTCCFDKFTIEDSLIFSFSENNIIYIINTSEIDYYDIGNTVRDLILSEYTLNNDLGYMFSMVISSTFQTLKRKGFPVEKLYNTDMA